MNIKEFLALARDLDHKALKRIVEKNRFYSGIETDPLFNIKTASHALHMNPQTYVATLASKHMVALMHMAERLSTVDDDVFEELAIDIINYLRILYVLRNEKD